MGGSEYVVIFFFSLEFISSLVKGKSSKGWEEAGPEGVVVVENSNQ